MTVDKLGDDRLCVGLPISEARVNVTVSVSGRDESLGETLELEGCIVKVTVREVLALLADGQNVD